ncbi:ricin-type beta-trefoil lectin domain protein [Streptomyces sp. NPDC014006]|uniref:ricin-type beta-trefoil lectin domain protein n=1 Tax=Streptomyces sp. NPDC014006 TaxID=3364870 RepID=UPI0036F695E5
MPGESDRDLVAQLATPDGRGRAVALLLARHWSAARDYAAVCLASPGETAQLVATAAVHQVLDRLAAGRVGGALRPQILVAVRDTVRSWVADRGLSALLPELRKTTGGRGLRATGGGIPEKRQLAERAFRALPSAAQCLLWHTEVEAEAISIPAGLLAVHPGTAAAALEQAREQFRAGCVRAHRELAPTDECRFHTRLLDAPLRRGGHLLPDVRRHLAECRYCRQAAEQLSHFDGALDVLLAETVLGWGARRYLDSRPGRGASPGVAHTRRGGRHRGAPSPGRPTASARHTKAAVLAGVGLAALALLATVLATQSRSGDNAVPGAGPGRRSARTWGPPAAGTGASTRPAGPVATPRSPGSPTAASAVRPAPLLKGRLRNAATGRCLDADAGRVRSGAAAELADCSPAASQRWTFGADGRLRSAADPALCLLADPFDRRVALADCADAAAYDLTVRGELLLRGRAGLGLAPAEGSATTVTIAPRDASARGRWVFDTGTAQGGLPRPRSDGPAPTDVPGGPSGPSEPAGRPRPFHTPGDQPATPRFVPVVCCAELPPAVPRRPSAAVAASASVLSGATTVVSGTVPRIASAAVPTAPLPLVSAP